MGERDRKKKSRRRDYSSSSSLSRNSSYDSDSRRSDRYSRKKKVKKSDKQRDRSSSEDTKKKDKNSQQQQFQQFGGMMGQMGLPGMQGIPGMQGLPGMNMNMMGIPGMMGMNMNMMGMQGMNNNLKKGNMNNMMGMMGMMNPGMMNNLNMGGMQPLFPDLSKSMNINKPVAPPFINNQVQQKQQLPAGQIKPAPQNLLVQNALNPLPMQSVIQNPTLQFQQQDRFQNKEITDSEVYSTFKNRFILPVIVEQLVSINFNSKVCNQQNILIICKQILNELEQKSKELGNKKIQKEIQIYLEKLPQDIEKEIAIQKKKLKDANDSYIEKKREQNRCNEEEILKLVYSGENICQILATRKIDNSMVDLGTYLEQFQNNLSNSNNFYDDEDDQLFQETCSLINNNNSNFTKIENQ